MTLNSKLVIKVLKQIDEDILSLVLVINRTVKDPVQHGRLMVEIQQKRECARQLLDHYQKVLAREQGKKVIST